MNNTRKQVDGSGTITGRSLSKGESSWVGGKDSTSLGQKKGASQKKDKGGVGGVESNLPKQKGYEEYLQQRRDRAGEKASKQGLNNRKNFRSRERHVMGENVGGNGKRRYVKSGGQDNQEHTVTGEDD